MDSLLIRDEFNKFSDTKKNGFLLRKIENQVRGANSMPTTISATLFFVLFAVCLGLVCGNVYLNFELAGVRHDLDALTQEFGNFQIDDIEGFSRAKDETIETDEDNKDSNENEEATQSKLIHSIMQKNNLKQSLNATINHFIVKRSSSLARLPSVRLGKGRKSTWRGQKNDIKKRLRKHKAIAIHIQAKRSLSDFNHPLNMQGKKITGWMQPSNRYVGFDTTFLQSDGYVTVPSDGLYFVYSQVVFRTSDVPYMVAEIGVKSIGAQTFTKCQFSRQNNATTGSYVACHSNGVVFLRGGEGLSLMVSPSNVHVYMSPQHTYFGAFLVGLA